MAPAHPDYEPWASSQAVRATMLGNVRRDTRPELILRSALHARGWRFRVQYPVPDRPRRSIDIAFTRRRLAILVDGCFWHGCPLHGSNPKTNVTYWNVKIERNRARDGDTDIALLTAGWRSLRVWEHMPVTEAVKIIETELRIIDAAGQASTL